MPRYLNSPLIFLKPCQIDEATGRCYTAPRDRNSEIGSSLHPLLKGSFSFKSKKFTGANLLQKLDIRLLII
jgi:hypothetical protein